MPNSIRKRHISLYNKEIWRCLATDATLWRQPAKSGGGGNRTPDSFGAIPFGGMHLEECPLCVAAMWLNSQVTDEHELARIGKIVKTWPKLPV